MDNGAQPHCGTFYLGKVQVGRPIGQVLADHPFAIGVARAPLDPSSGALPPGHQPPDQ